METSQQAVKVVQTQVEVIRCTLGTVPSGADVSLCIFSASDSVVEVAGNEGNVFRLPFSVIQLAKNVFQTLPRRSGRVVEDSYDLCKVQKGCFNGKIRVIFTRMPKIKMLDSPHETIIY